MSNKDGVEMTAQGGKSAAKKSGNVVAKPVRGSGGGGGSKTDIDDDDEKDEVPKAIIPIAGATQEVANGEPPPFQQYTGKDFVKLYGHPDRWACLDSSDLYEDDEVLLLKTHSCISKAVAATVWMLSLGCLCSTLWAIYIYLNATGDPVSPKYYQTKLCGAITTINAQTVNDTLKLQCDVDSVSTIPTIGDFFWLIWAFLFLCMMFLGCCAPPDRILVLEKERNIGYVREKNWNMCSIVCARVHCGVPRTICEFTPSVVYMEMQTEKRIDGASGWGVTRWGLQNPTKILVLRDLHDGALLHAIDAHDILCCYDHRCCLKEAEYMLVTLKQRLESHLRMV